MNANEPHTAVDMQQLKVVVGRFTAELMNRSMGDVLQIVRRADLSLPRMVTLTYLSRHSGASISEIGDYLNLSLGATSHLVDQLVEHGYVTRFESLIDRRHKQVEITVKGRELVDEMRQARADEAARLLGELPAPLLATLSTTLSEVLEYWEAVGSRE